MMRRTFGAPLGGTTVGGQYGLESLASILMVPPNGAGGDGRYLPSIVVVALGEPGAPVICCAYAADPVRISNAQPVSNSRAVPSVKIRRPIFMMVPLPNTIFEASIVARRFAAQHCP